MDNRVITDAEIVAAMSAYGGSFVQALAGAAMRADDKNLAILKAAFGFYWDEYAELVRARGHVLAGKPQREDTNR